MNLSSHAINTKINRLQNLLGNSVDETERRTVQRLLNKEKAKAALRLLRRDVDVDRMIRK
jgi:hypothetical protein